MAGSFWPELTVPIVLLPGGEQGERVMQLARSWINLGLLGPALWVRPEDVSIEEGAPPLVVARVLKLGADRQVFDVRRDLFEVLARDKLRRVRVLKVRSAAPHREIDVLQDHIASELVEYVKYSVPTPDPQQNAADQVILLSETTLICAPTEFQVTQRVAWATDDLGLVVVASPEDRSSPWSGDAFVRDNDRFVGFTLMHIATIAGLWNAVPTGTFDLFERESSTQGNIWVSRVFVNAVIMDGFARRVAASVLSDAADGDAELVDSRTSVPPIGTVFIGEEQRSHYIQQLVAGIFGSDRGGLDYHENEQFLTRSRARFSFFDMLRAFGSFSLDKIVAIPKWFTRWFTRRLSRATTEAFHGQDGLAVVGMQYRDYDVRDRILLNRRTEIAVEEEAARTSSIDFVATSAVKSTPILWARLRKILFGVLDGSADLSDIGFAPIEGRNPIFSRVGDVVRPSIDRWKFPREERPNEILESYGTDSLETSGLHRDKITKWVHAATATIAELSEKRTAALLEIAGVNVRRDELAILLHEHGLAEFDDAGVPSLVKGKRAPSRKKPVVDADGQEGDEDILDLVALKREFAELPTRAEAAARSLEAIGALIESAQVDRELRDGILLDFDRWVASHSGSAYGQIVDGMAQRVSRANQALNEAEAALAEIQLPEPDRLIKLRKTFHALIGVSFLGLLGFLAVIALITRFATALPGWWPEYWQVVALSIVVYLCAVLGQLIHYYRGWSRFERLLLEVGDGLEWAVGAIRHNRQELRRMQILHGQCLEWIRLLADAMHAPWSVEKEWLSATVPDVNKNELPYAMQLAVTREDDPVAAARIKRDASHALLVKGWRARAFKKLLDELCGRLGYDATTLGIEALDADLPHASNHSRRILLEHSRDPEVMVTIAQDYLGEIVAEVQGVSLSQSNPRVTRIAADVLTGSDVTPGAAAGIREAPLEWDHFLIDSVTRRSSPVTPIGSLGIAQIALPDAYHERALSYLLLPQRLADQVGATVQSDRFKVTGYPDDEVRATDIVVRVDVAGPLPASAARLWENVNSSRRGSERAAAGGREGL